LIEIVESGIIQLEATVEKRKTVSFETVSFYQKLLFALTYYLNFCMLFQENYSNLFRNNNNVKLRKFILLGVTRLWKKVI
jgi:hypothetical protein